MDSLWVTACAQQEDMLVKSAILLLRKTHSKLNKANTKLASGNMPKVKGKKTQWLHRWTNLARGSDASNIAQHNGCPCSQQAEHNGPVDSSWIINGGCAIQCFSIIEVINGGTSLALRYKPWWAQISIFGMSNGLKWGLGNQACPLIYLSYWHWVGSWSKVEALERNWRNTTWSRQSVCCSRVRSEGTPAWRRCLKG